MPNTLTTGIKIYNGNETVTRLSLMDNFTVIDGLFKNAGGHDHSGADGKGPKITSSGLADGAATDTVIGNRTITDTTAAASGADTLTGLVSKIGNMIKGITGKTNWYTPPAITLETINTKFGTTGHSHDGTAGNGPKITSSGLANGAATDTVIGNRTITDTTAQNTGAAATLATLLGQIGNALKTLKGTANWYADPAITLAAVKLHVDNAENPHNTTASQVGAVPLDGSSAMTGALQLSGAPTANNHAGTKAYIDAGDALSRSYQ